MKYVNNQNESIALKMDLQTTQNFALSRSYVLRSFPEKFSPGLIKIFEKLPSKILGVAKFGAMI